MPDAIEDELAKLRKRIADQRRRAERTEDTPSVEVIRDGARVGFSVPDDEDPTE